MTGVKHLSRQDLDEAVALIVKAHDQSEAHKHIPINAEKVKQNLEGVLMNPYAVALYNGKGLMIGLASPSPWHDGLTINDVFCFAEGGGLSLIKAFLKWAKAFPGTNEINLGVTFGGDAGERTEQLYERMGFERTGSTFKMRTQS